jgi:hypothetical protein
MHIILWTNKTLNTHTASSFLLLLQLLQIRPSALLQLRMKFRNCLPSLDIY